MFSATEVRKGKPAPDLFLHAARCMETEVARCAVVEDSPRGVRAGVAAGMTVLGYAGRTPRAELEEAGARCFDEMRKLPGMLDALSASD